jgi:hypothetical protein
MRCAQPSHPPPPLGAVRCLASTSALQPVRTRCSAGRRQPNRIRGRGAVTDHVAGARSTELVAAEEEERTRFAACAGWSAWGNEIRSNCTGRVPAAPTGARGPGTSVRRSTRVRRSTDCDDEPTRLRSLRSRHRVSIHVAGHAGTPAHDQRPVTIKEDGWCTACSTVRISL